MTKVNLTFLRRLRYAKKLSRREVGEILGKDPVTIWRYEKGRTPIKADVLFQLADLYGASLNDLYSPE
jgi:transcriptional regulator with XRE-family HTH domain